MSERQGLGLFKLTCFAIGTTLASGVFSSFADMANNGAGTLAVLIGWAIAGIGMYCLAMCFNRLSIVKPNLKSGIFAYAKEGFGEYIGFNAAWGYWISAILSQVSFATLLFAALGQFMPMFGDGNNLASVIGASLLIWAFTILIMGGVQEAVTINAVIVIGQNRTDYCLLLYLLYFWEPSTSISSWTISSVRIPVFPLENRFLRPPIQQFGYSPVSKGLWSFPAEQKIQQLLAKQRNCPFSAC